MVHRLGSLILALLALLTATAPANAAVLSFDFGTPGQTSGTVSYDTQLGVPTGFGDQRRIVATFSNLYLLGKTITSTNVQAFAGTSGGQQLVAFNGFFTSPFQPVADFNPSFSLLFAANDNGLIAGDKLASALVMAPYFVSGAVSPTSSQVISFTLAVPEPAAWSLMIVGIAGIGATLRRRRVGVVQALAAA